MKFVIASFLIAAATSAMAFDETNYVGTVNVQDTKLSATVSDSELLEFSVGYSFLPHRFYNRTANVYTELSYNDTFDFYEATAEYQIQPSHRSSFSTYGSAGLEYVKADNFDQTNAIATLGLQHNFGLNSNVFVELNGEVDVSNTNNYSTEIEVGFLSRIADGVYISPSVSRNLQTDKETFVFETILNF